MSAFRCASLLLVTLASALQGAELPPRAIAQIGSHRFYHGPGIESAVLSPDGKRLASTARHQTDPYFMSADDDAYARTIVLWDAATGKRLRELKPPQRPDYLTFSPDGKELTAACESSVFVFDVESGKLLHHIKGFEHSVRSLRFSADGKRLFVSDLSSVTSLDAATMKRQKRWTPPTGPSRWIKEGEIVLRRALSPDGTFIAWHLWEYPDLSKLPPGLTYEELFRPTAVVVTDMSTEKPLCRKEFPKHPLEAFAFSHDGRRFMTRGEKLTAWETATGKELFTLAAPLAHRIALSPDGRRAVIADGASRLQVWDVESRKALYELGSRPGSINSSLLANPQVFSGDGKTLLLATDSTLRLFDVATGKERPPPGHCFPVTLRFSHDGRSLFTSCKETEFGWDISGKEPVLKSEAKQSREGIGGLQALAHSADGRLFLDKLEGRVRVRETATGRVQRELEGDSRQVISGKFSPDGNRALLHHFPEVGPRTVQLYNANTGMVSGEIKPLNETMVFSRGMPRYSPNGRLLAWTDCANDVHVHDAVTGKLVRVLRSSVPLPSRDVFGDSLLFSPDSEYLAVTTYDVYAFGMASNPTRVFCISSGREISRFSSKPKNSMSDTEFWCEGWSPDGRILAVADVYSRKVRLIEIASGTVRAEFAGHLHGVHDLAFSLDGKTLASGGKDNVVFLWDVTGAQTGPPRKESGDTDLTSWWTALADRDAGRAADSIASLISTPVRSVAFLKQQLHPVGCLDEKRLARLMADLDDANFKKREAASRELSELGLRVEARLRRVREAGPTLELRRRIDQLLDRLELMPTPPESLRELRAVEALEHLGTPAAKQVLERLATGADDARLTQEAKQRWHDWPGGLEGSRHVVRVDDAEDSKLRCRIADDEPQLVDDSRDRISED